MIDFLIIATIAALLVASAGCVRSLVELADLYNNFHQHKGAKTMKVFAVHNIDNELVKVFDSADKAFAWVEDQCQFWAKNMGEECSLRTYVRPTYHFDCDAGGNEVRVDGSLTLISCQSGSEYTITPMELE